MCLQIGHRANQCDPAKKCRRCGGRHHQSICERTAPKIHASGGEKENTGGSKEQEKPEGNANKAPTVTACQNSTSVTTRSKCKVLLQTATAYAYSKGQDDLVPVRVLITELYYISRDRAPDRKVSPKTWRILRHNRPTFMGASTDQWLKCPCATEFIPPPLT